MKISLIENGLDSLKKGYDFLTAHEQTQVDHSTDMVRFSLLKDSILSVQHGIEILFKYVLRKNNEVLLYSDLNAKLKSAFVSRRNGEIQELFQADGVHTVSFKESLERARDICGINIPEKLQKKLLKVEKWRNALMHSAVSLPEQEVSGVLRGLMRDLDQFFSAEIGVEYITGQGRLALERAYNMLLASSSHVNSTKAIVVRRLIDALREHGIANVTSPGVFMIDDVKKANGVLEEIQGEDISYGCDAINYHCSGKAEVNGATANGAYRIYTHDNQSYYDVGLKGIVVYVPALDDELSPLIFIYSSGLKSLTSNPLLHNVNGVEVQEGVALEGGSEVWDANEVRELMGRIHSDEGAEELGGARNIYRFITPGCAMFLNIQKLRYGRADELIHEPKFQDMNNLYSAFQGMIKA